MTEWVQPIVAGLRRPVVASLVAALLVGAFVLLAAVVGGGEHSARVSLLAGPAEPAGATTSQYGEVVSLTLPALVELARGPSVLGSAAAEAGMAPGELADGISVELVPASALARLSVRAPTAEQAGAAVSAIARSLIMADLLAPAARLRLLDERPEIVRVAPDWPLAIGLALVAAAVAAVATAALHHLCRTRAGAPAVRAALAAAGVRHPVPTVPVDAPDLPERLATLCAAAARPARVAALVPGLAERAEALARRLPDKCAEPAEGTAVIAVTDGSRDRHDELSTLVAVLPGSDVLVAVVVT